MEEFISTIKGYEFHPNFVIASNQYWERLLVTYKTKFVIKRLKRLRVYQNKFFYTKHIL